MNDRSSQDVEELIDRFRRWLEEARVQAAALGSDGACALDGPDEHTGAPVPEFGLVNLVEGFTALRHELKLQTKSGRGLIEQAESMVAALERSIEQFRSVEPKEAQAAWSAGRSLAEALGDLDEALTRGRREIERINRRLGEDSTMALADAIDDRFRRQSWLRRLLTADFHRQVKNVVQGDAWLRRDLLEALLEGYGLIQARLARVMASEQVVRIPCEGRPVDPERMTVIEVVDDTDRPPGTVVKELRSGYTWKGRLLRYAEVQAASGASGNRLRADDGAGDGVDVDEDTDSFPEDEDVGVDLDFEADGPGAGRPPH
jgi:molecular chaperone GrpE